MKIKIGTILLILIISLSALMGFRQYQRDGFAKKSTESEPQTEISWNTPYGKATMKKVADLGESYDMTKSYYKDYDDTGLETCMLTLIFADSEENAIKQVRNTGQCKYAYLTEDGNCEIKLTEEQRIWWLQTAKNTLADIKKNNDDYFSFEISEDYKKLHIFADAHGDGVEFDGNVMRIMYAIEIIQMFSGADDWNVEITLTNVSNGVDMVKVNYPKEELVIEPKMWEE